MQTSADTDEQIVQVALDSWSAEGQLLLPQSFSSTGSSSAGAGEKQQKQQHLDGVAISRRPSVKMATRIVVGEEQG